MNTVLLFIFALCGIISTIFVVLLSWQLRKESRDFLRILTSPKPAAPPPMPQYLTYEKCMPMFTKFVILCFQREYISRILPNITNASGKISLLSPNDQVYAGFISSTVTQVFVSLPNYLQKSVFYYYNVIDRNDPKDEGLDTLTLAITTQVKALLDQHIIKNAEIVETLGPTSEPILKEINRFANTVAGKKYIPKSPDGSEVSVIGI